ncbi:unnamed protein product [Callosobruchus maculatus]|uniref:Uncharacterized protein n=1 Tax=Callosobruchus maculatus TaxID=64391 RepID=A0A653DEZ9_CALMS|nr:unnamed protein product [Callosobruchus maculatus]
MGIRLSRLLSRIFDYPLKSNRPDIITCHQSGIDNTTRGKSDYDLVVEEFTKRLLEKRQQNRSSINGKSWEEREFLLKFPGWNESTVGYLHSLFLSCYNQKDKMLDLRGL